MRTTFQCKTNEAGQLHVTIGKWTAIPTGPWAENAQRTLSWHTTPILTKAIVRWYEITKSNDLITIYQYSFNNKKAFNQPFQSDLDRWSMAVTRPKTKGIAVSLETDNLDHRSFRISLGRLQKLPTGDVESILEGLRALDGESLYTKAIQTNLDMKRADQKKTGAVAAAKAKETRTAAKKGGNPKTFKEGDIVITTYPMTFRSGITLNKFHFVKSRTDDKPHFYAQIDEDGFGIGTRYKATKKYLRRVCPNAFLEITRFSAHEQLQLLTEQAALGGQLVDA